MAKKDPYNQLQYLKKQYETAGDNDGQRKWASSQADNYYSQLKTGEANQVRNMNASQLGDYRSQLDNTPAPVGSDPTPSTKPQTQTPTYKAPVRDVDVDSYKMEGATIEDLQKKYGFDYSRDYAATQAETAAQQKRDNVESGRREANTNVESAAEGLDRNYFQQALQQQQAQTNSGLNAGIASDQDLRMSMGRQAEMGDIYRDRNLTLADLQDQSGRIENERIAQEEALFNNRLTQGFDQIMQRDGLRLQENQALLNADLSRRGQDIDSFNADRNFGLQEGQLQGNYLTEGQQGIFNGIADLKRRYAETDDPIERAMITREAQGLQAQASAEGINPSLVGSDVSLADMTQNMSEFGQTQAAREANRAMTETERAAKVREEQQQAQLEESIRSNKFREELSREQFEKPYDSLTRNQQEQINLQEAQQELSYEMFDRPYTENTYQEKSLIDVQVARMKMEEGAGSVGGPNTSNDSYDPYNTGSRGTFPLAPGNFPRVTGGGGQ